MWTKCLSTPSTKTGGGAARVILICSLCLDNTHPWFSVASAWIRVHTGARIGRIFIPTPCLLTVCSQWLRQSWDPLSSENPCPPPKKKTYLLPYSLDSCTYCMVSFNCVFQWLRQLPDSGNSSQELVKSKSRTKQESSKLGGSSSLRHINQRSALAAEKKTSFASGIGLRPSMEQSFVC